MSDRNIVWLPSVRNKLIKYRNYRFTPDETLVYISQIVLEIESLLKNPILGRTYTEEVGDYRGVSRVLVKKFRIYYQQVHNDIVIVAILFPGEK